MRLAALFSGGKDSTYALYLASKEHEIKYLVSIISENPESYMFHTQNIELTKIQAELIGLPIIIRVTKGEKEKELKDLQEALGSIRKEIDGVVCGAIESEYQRSRVARICERLELKCLTPLWKKDPFDLLKDMLNAGFKIMIVAVGAAGLTKEWLGRIIDFRCLEELAELNKKYKIHIAGEGGEFETFVLDCPLFAKRIEIENYEIVWDKKTSSGGLLIKKVRLSEK